MSYKQFSPGIRPFRAYLGHTATQEQAPLNLKPYTTAPTAQEAGDVGFHSTNALLMFSNGTQMVPVVGRRKIITTAQTLTPADAGALCLFNLNSGVLYTLPTAETGLWFEFRTNVTITSGSAKVLTSSASEFLVGGFVQVPDTAAQIVVRAADGSTHRSWNGNGTTTGGIIGDNFFLQAISATQWSITGYGLATGTEATPFATS